MIDKIGFGRPRRRIFRLEPSEQKLVFFSAFARQDQFTGERAMFQRIFGTVVLRHMRSP
jgi:hypothetical protein